MIEELIENTEKEHAKSDIHTGKIIRRYMQYGLNKIQELKEKYK